MLLRDLLHEGIREKKIREIGFHCLLSFILKHADRQLIAACFIYFRDFSHIGHAGLVDAALPILQRSHGYADLFRCGFLGESDIVPETLQLFCKLHLLPP